MFVLDTSAYINGQRDHYPLATFPSVWTTVGEGMADGRIVTPREVYREIKKKDDDVAEWADDRKDVFVDPSEEVQRAVGAIYASYPGIARRDAADPFVIAEAQIRGLTVVTYEGRSFSGIPISATRWMKSMPGVCKRINVPCRTLPEALTMLGASF